MLDEQKAAGREASTRKPLSMIGKVFKYEFIATARRLALVYALIPVAAVIVGIFFRNTLVPALLSDGTVEFDAPDRDRLMVTGMILYLFAYIFIIVASILTLVVLYGRFRKGMFGSEAYLNFTLPVSAGEHLCARVLCAVAWDLIFMATMLLSFLLFVLCSLDRILAGLRAAHVPSWAELQARFVSEAGFSLGELAATVPVLLLTGSVLFVLFLYMISCVGHLVRRRRTLLQFVTVIAFMAVANVIMTRLFMRYQMAAGYGEASNTIALLWTLIAANVVFAAVCGAVCYLILRFRLNLE